ncbi:MAG: hypothetical protein JRF32_02395 [Deltaproteobacteria bacterium]|nr:hypothetical protein [Deltaproteobacteria bacterium]MBW2296444.1 hypothetical protein [Deltaproteobacteria bacterium]
MDDNNEWTMNLSLPRARTSELRGRQSVRATFKLTEACIGAISIVAAHLGIKQKSLFDHLVEDINTLNSIAGELSNVSLRNYSRVQKTYVISRKSLYSLDEVSKSHNAPRDALVEYSVQRLLPVIINEQKKHEARKKIMSAVANHFNNGQALLKKLENTLGHEDPLFGRLETLMTHYRNTYDGMRAFIEKGKIIEDFQPEILRRILSTTKK